MVFKTGNLQVASGKSSSSLAYNEPNCEDGKKTEKYTTQSNDSAQEDNNSDIVSELTGHIGKWQLMWAFFLSLFQFPSTFHLFAFVFEGATKDFWCAAPDHLKSIPTNIWRNITQPKNSCSIIDVNFNEISAENFTEMLSNASSKTLVECKSFEYDMDLIGKTIISEWQLICNKATMVSNVEMCFLAGAAVGSVCSGWISDQFGRRFTLMSFATVQCCIGILLAFASSLSTFMVLRFISGVASMGVLVVSFVLVVELVSGKYRTIIGILNLLPLSISYMVIAGIAYAARDWRTIQLIGSVPCLLLLIMWLNVPESPRWLLARGKMEELKEIINRIAVRNRITLPDNYEKLLISPSDVNDTVSILDLFKGKYRRTTLLMIVIWFSLVLLYFGITLHMNNLGGDIYINTIIAGAVEGVAILCSIIVVLKLGIRINLVIYMLVAGLACLMVNFVPDGNLWIIITLVMIGKCTIGATNAIIQTFTAYQYPTMMRNLGVGTGNFAAGVALIVVPYLWLMEHIQSFLPMTIMGGFGIIGAVALMLLQDRSPKPKSHQRDQTQSPPAHLKIRTAFDNSAYKHTET
ncbi:organic cation transporter protein-like isoform X1 [Phlebotomus argentipes]|uniref:organic cation transporter protein-like isoform X1 n=1 Tax=Phlebotomus argentipes TaxID=94469 RepID=UPI0028936165|nr:organic cation transporter protein-like isoform X1 [Phlebotomus argentipes]